MLFAVFQYVVCRLSVPVLWGAGRNEFWKHAMLESAPMDCIKVIIVQIRGEI